MYRVQTVVLHLCMQNNISIYLEHEELFSLLRHYARIRSVVVGYAWAMTSSMKSRCSYLPSSNTPRKKTHR